MRSATPRRYASPTSRWRPSTSQPTHGILNGIIRSAQGHPYDALILERLLSSNSDFVGRIPKDGDDPTGFPIRVDERRPVEAIAALPTDRKRGIGLLDMDCFEVAVSGERCGQLIRAVEQPCITGVS